jgi:aryl-alcohol dehydrogenase-like predicted oxidoreductase
MSYIKLGNSALEVSEICFGAWAIGGWLWGGTDEAAALRALDAAIDTGVTSIDTAAIYGFGLSEEIVGKAIRGKRDKVQIMTKYGLRWDDTRGEFFFDTKRNDGTPVNIHSYASKESIITECENSLRRLNTDYIDLYQQHWPDRSTPVEESMEALDQLIKQGKVRAAGGSNYTTEDMAKAQTVVPQASNQVAYSMVQRGIEDEIVPYCMANNIGIVVYSPMQRGILTGKIKPGHQFNPGDSRPDTPYYKPENVKRINAFLDKIKPVADGKGVTLAQLVLRWTLQMPGVTSVLAGIRNEEQLKENAVAMEFELNPEEMDFINKHLHKLEILMDLS